MLAKQSNFLEKFTFDTCNKQIMLNEDVIRMAFCQIDKRSNYMSLICNNFVI